VNVLADRHHAGLLYSLQLLFEDRLGFTLYIPIGREWWDLGFWRFGQSYGDDRLVRQYLHINDAELILGADEATPARNAEPTDQGYYVLRDMSEYPDRPIRCVTTEQFKTLGDFQFVIATVPDNAPGFAAVAKAAGAQFVYQVGNHNQFVDWTLDPLVISSSEAPILGRGVTIHQEFEKDTTFRYREPSINGPDMRSTASFVNCFNRIPTELAYWRAARAELPDWRFAMHGSDGDDGKIGPCPVLADTIAAHGFGWHDKPHGDGFGHVIHYLASVGRPLVGNSRNYAGLFAGPLWEDGVTCIDTQGRAPHEVAERLREVVSDSERYVSMCQAIRTRVDELCDFDAEELLVRDLLGL
jgi:hypothetical protein